MDAAEESEMYKAYKLHPTMFRVILTIMLHINLYIPGKHKNIWTIKNKYETNQTGAKFVQKLSVITNNVPKMPKVAWHVSLQNN